MTWPKYKLVDRLSQAINAKSTPYDDDRQTDGQTLTRRDYINNILNIQCE